jgi:glycerophosphoryl diester phosphodiesterase
MSGNGARALRIAHAYGNLRDKIETAAAADVDFIEADLWYRAGEVWVRHERRLGCLPLLYDRRPVGVESVGPWAIPLFARYYLRLDVDPLRLTELLGTTRGRRRLLLDIKDKLDEEDGRAYAGVLVRILAEAGCEESAILCGQTATLDSVREIAPQLDVRYTVEKQGQWDGFLRRLDTDRGLRGVSMYYKFLSDPVARFLEENGLEVFCWTVDDPEEARRLVALGADGITSNSIPLLEELGDT